MIRVIRVIRIIRVIKVIRVIRAIRSQTCMFGAGLSLKSGGCESKSPALQPNSE